MGYYIGIEGMQQGPFELNDLPAKGLRADLLVWTDGMVDWKRADQVPEVAALLVAPSLTLTDPGHPPPVPAPPLQAGGPLQYHTPVVAAQPNGMAIASLVLGILAFPLMCAQGLGLVAAILAIVFGFIARSRAKRGEAGNSGMALAGIILGFIPIALAIVFFAIVMIFVISNKNL